MSKSINNHFYLDQCLKIANESVEAGNHPFGALLLSSNSKVITQGNEVNTRGDVTSHAELLLVQKAQKTLTKEELSNSVLYTSTEPCAMCSGAIYWAGIKKVVYACSSSVLNEIVGGSLSLSCDEVFEKGVHKTHTIHLSDIPEAKEIHKKFW